jgi:hypothetical protein
MLIATSAVAVLVASSLASGALAPVTYPAPPPIVVNVSAAATVPSSLVALTIAEAESIFRSAGISFMWRFGPPALATLNVVIGDAVGSASGDVTALGWIAFEDGHPDQQIYLSHGNAVKFLLDSRGVVGLTTNMPRAEREVMLGRVMGRALAHELGHYLLATKVHTPKGLLKAVRSAQEFFASDRTRFQLSPGQRGEIAMRLNGEALLASGRPAAGERRPGGPNQ